LKQTKNSQAKEAEVTALNTLKNFVNKTVSPQQLQDAKDNIIVGSSLKKLDIITCEFTPKSFDLHGGILQSAIRKQQNGATLHLLPPTLKVISLSVMLRTILSVDPP
jgi:hypothetical protein